METPASPVQNSTRPRRRGLRVLVSVRALMLVVVVIGGVLGWVVYRARIQRDTVAAIERSGGILEYEWQFHRKLHPSGYFIRVSTPSGQPRAPAWLVEQLGVDYFGNVTRVEVRDRLSDSMLWGIGRVSGLQDLLLVGGSTSTDAGLDELHRLTKLNSLALWRGDSRFTGAGLKNFGDLTLLENLILSDIPLRGDDLAFLANLTRLRGLSIHGTKLSDGHMSYLSGLTRLQSLIVDSTDVTDVGLSHLDGLVRLRVLGFSPSRITSAGLTHLRGMSALARFFAYDSLIDDLTPIGHLTGITEISLSRCPIDDRGLAPVARFQVLQVLHLTETAVSDAGMVHLRELPRLRLLALGKTRVTDAGLSHLATLPALQNLFLDRTTLDGSGLAYLKTAPALSELVLAETRVSDSALSELAAYPSLTVVDLSRTRITDVGLKQLASAVRSPSSTLKTALKGLLLNETKVSDDGIAQLDGFLALTQLDVRGTKVTDAGLKHLANAKGMNPYLRLDVQQTKVTDDGVEALRKARPGWYIAR